jgi:hypothetical protein
MAKPKKPKPKPKPPKYTWILTPSGVNCFADPNGGQTLLPLWEVDTMSSFHDQTLASATKEINAILARCEASRASDDMVLSFIEFQDRLMLVWARYDVVSSYDEDEEIIKAFGLKVEPPTQSTKSGGKS